MDSPCVQKSRAQDHDSFTRALLQLHLDGAELAVDDAHHPLDLLGRDGPGPALLAQQVHHVGGELIACLGWQEKQKKPQDGKVIRWCQGQDRGSMAMEGDVSGGLTGWGFSEQPHSKNVLVLRGERNFSALPSTGHERLPTNMLGKAGANFFAPRGIMYGAGADEALGFM